MAPIVAARQQNVILEAQTGETQPSNGGDHLDKRGRERLLPLLSDASVASIIKELASNEAPALAAKTSRSSQSMEPSTSEALPQVSARIGKVFRSSVAERQYAREIYEKNKAHINRWRRMIRDLEKTLHTGPGPMPSQVKRSQRRAERKQREQAEVEAQALLNPGAPVPLTRLQLLNKRRNARQKERKAAQKAESQKAKTDDTSARSAFSEGTWKQSLPSEAENYSFTGTHVRPQLNLTPATTWLTPSQQAAHEQHPPTLADIQRLARSPAASSSSQPTSTRPLPDSILDSILESSQRSPS